jgi:hypothetical protein
MPDPIADHNHGASEDKTVSQIAERYLEFARQYCAASGAAPSPPQG